MEFLKELLSEETYNKLAEELKDKEVKLADLSKGEYVAKAKYDTALKDVDSFKEQLAQRDSDLENLKKTATLSDEQKKELETLQSKYESEKQEWETKLAENARNAALEISVAKSGVIDPVALKAHIAEKAKELEFKDGSIIGLDEYIKDRITNDLSYLVPKEQKALGQEINKGAQTTKTEKEQVYESLGIKKGDE